MKKLKLEGSECFSHICFRCGAISEGTDLKMKKYRAHGMYISVYNGKKESGVSLCEKCFNKIGNKLFFDFNEYNKPELEKQNKDEYDDIEIWPMHTTYEDRILYSHLFDKKNGHIKSKNF